MTTHHLHHRQAEADLVEAEVFPLAPLEAAAGHLSARALALQLGVTRRTVNRWRRAGRVPAGQADTAAVRLGHHPAEIWPTEWNAA